QEVLWAAAQQFGLRLEAGDQVAVARELARTEPHLMTTDLVQNAFRTAKVAPPSDRLAREVVARAQRVRPRPGLREVLLSFREDAIRTLSRQYGGKDKDEDSLRNNLVLYLRPRGYAEAHTSKG